jgi:hypothetical protein
VAKQEQPAPAAQPPPMSYKSKLNERIMKMRVELPTYSTIRTAGGFLSTLVLNGQGKNNKGNGYFRSDPSEHLVSSPYASLLLARLARALRAENRSEVGLGFVFVQGDHSLSFLDFFSHSLELCLVVGVRMLRLGL